MRNTFAAALAAWGRGLTRIAPLLHRGAFVRPAMVVGAVSSLRKAVLKLDDLVAKTPHGGAMAHAKYQRDVVLPGMADLRKAADKLELLVADEYWPLPKYREMLFVR